MRGPEANKELPSKTHESKTKSISSGSQDQKGTRGNCGKLDSVSPGRNGDSNKKPVAYFEHTSTVHDSFARGESSKPGAVNRKYELGKKQSSSSSETSDSCDDKGTSARKRRGSAKDVTEKTANNTSSPGKRQEKRSPSVIDLTGETDDEPSPITAPLRKHGPPKKRAPSPIDSTSEIDEEPPISLAPQKKQKFAQEAPKTAGRPKEKRSKRHRKPDNVAEEAASTVLSQPQQETTARQDQNATPRPRPANSPYIQNSEHITLKHPRLSYGTLLNDLRLFFYDQAEYILHMLLNPEFTEKTNQYETARQRLDDFLAFLAENMFTSSRWNAESMAVLKSKPTMDTSAISDADAQKACGLCKQTRHAPTTVIKFFGAPYNHVTLHKLDVASRQPTTKSTYHARSTSVKNAENSHLLHHWRLKLSRDLRTHVEKDGHLSRENLHKLRGMTPSERREYVDNLLNDLILDSTVPKLYLEYRALRVLK